MSSDPKSMPRPHPRLTSIVAAAALAPVVAALAACSSATDPTTRALSAVEARTVANALFDQVLGAAGNTTDLSSQRAVGFVQLHAQRAVRPSAVRPRASATTTTLPINAACPLGGSITGSGTISENLDANGTGTEAAMITYAPQGCVVSAGSRNVTVNGAPAITMAINVPLVAGQPASTATVQVGGGFSWAGGTCRLNYTVSVTPNGTGTISGTACGQDVSGSY